MARNRRLDSGLSGKLESSVCSFTYNAEWPKQKYGQTKKKTGGMVNKVMKVKMLGSTSNCGRNTSNRLVTSCNNCKLWNIRKERMITE